MDILLDFLDEDGRLSTRPETKTQADLDRVIGLGKSQRVIDMFKVMLDAGSDWDWCEDYILYLNDVQTYDNFVPAFEWDEDLDVEVQVTFNIPEPVQPIRMQHTVIPYQTLRAALYPSLAEFADAYVHERNGNPAAMNKYVAECNCIKDLHPK